MAPELAHRLTHLRATGRSFLAAALAIVVAIGALALSSALSGAQAFAGEVRVYVAASLADVIEAMRVPFHEQTGHDLLIVPGSSGMLARQIEQGAPADLYVAANVDWMTYLAAAGAVTADSVTAIARNRLVVMRAADLPAPEAPLATLANLSRLVGDDRLAIGDPAAAPVGTYAREALQGAGVWAEFESRLVNAANAAALLVLVARGEVAAGIGYRSDAANTDGVDILLEIPAELHAPIVYQAGIVADGDREAAAAFCAFIAGPEGRDALIAHGLLAP